MEPGARTPEELEALLEDAFVVRDRDAVAAMFEPGAVLVVGDGSPARGREQIAACVTALWEHDRTYLAEPQRVIQARDAALVLGGQGISVMRRGGDGVWRYTISLVAFDQVST